MQTKMLHLRLGEDDTGVLDDLAAGMLSRQQVATVILSAALAAVRANPNALKFPPQFTVGLHDALPGLNEPAKPTSYKARK